MTRVQLTFVLLLSLLALLAAARHTDRWSSLPLAGTRYTEPPLYDTAVR